MKLLTLNTHSLVENNYYKKLLDFTEVILQEKPDIIALQEVNQTRDKSIIPLSDLKGFYPCEENIIIRQDNHAYNAVKILSENGLDYYWSWAAIKLGYEKFDEGIAILSRSEITEAESLIISKINDYNNWKTRKIIGIKNKQNPYEWFYSVHFGWWDDSEEPFKNQWENIINYINIKNKIWLMGDFNNSAEIRNQGYDMIEKSGWYDCYKLAEKKDSGITVSKNIDGWKDKNSDINNMRIDYIWCSTKRDIINSQVFFNGKNGRVISDHYGIMIEVKN